MRLGRPVNALSLQGSMPPFLPVWFTGGFCGAVSVSSLLSTPISRFCSLDLTQDAGETRLAMPCRAPMAIPRPSTSQISSGAPAACETCSAQSGLMRPHWDVPCRFRKRRLSEHTASCGSCGVICISSRVGQKTVLACRCNPVLHAGSVWTLHTNPQHLFC
jgi:hypothetical protein